MTSVCFLIFMPRLLTFSDPPFLLLLELGGFFLIDTLPAIFDAWTVDYSFDPFAPCFFEVSNSQKAPNKSEPSVPRTTVFSERRKSD